jgi:uncharacterized protein (DUF1800 family)
VPTLDRAAAAHLLRRVGWGPTAAEVDALVGMDRAAAVDQVMGAAAPPLVPPPNLNRPEQWKAQSDATDWWVTRMVTTTAPLLERMTLFWHGHFCSAQEKVVDMAAMFAQQQIFRSLGMGKLRDLTKAVALSSAMLVYLDNADNVKGAEQENFARELMELFTIGIGNFTEADVVAMAKAWTGYNIVGWTGTTTDTTFVYRSDKHDMSVKTLFGVSQPWFGPQAIDALCSGAQGTATARFIAKKLFSFFANTTPAAATIDALSATFAASDLDISVLVRAILMHDEFWAPESRYALVKSPVDFVVSTLRRTGIPVASAGLNWNMDAMGQVLFDPPDVSGWKQNAYWISTATLSARGKWLEFLRWQVDGGLLPGLQQMTAAAAVQRIFDRFAILDPEPATRARLEAWFTNVKTAPGWLGWSLDVNGLVVGAMCPDWQVM